MESTQLGQPGWALPHGVSRLDQCRMVVAALLRPCWRNTPPIVPPHPPVHTAGLGSGKGNLARWRRVLIQSQHRPLPGPGCGGRVLVDASHAARHGVHAGLRAAPLQGARACFWGGV